MENKIFFFSDFSFRQWRRTSPLRRLIIDGNVGRHVLPDCWDPTATSSTHNAIQSDGWIPARHCLPSPSGCWPTIFFPEEFATYVRKHFDGKTFFLSRINVPDIICLQLYTFFFSDSGEIRRLCVFCYLRFCVIKHTKFYAIWNNLTIERVFLLFQWILLFSFYFEAKQMQSYKERWPLTDYEVIPVSPGKNWEKGEHGLSASMLYGNIISICTHQKKKEGDGQQPPRGTHRTETNIF